MENLLLESRDRQMAGAPKTRVRDERSHLEMVLKAMDDAEHHAKMFAISDAAKNDDALKQAALNVRAKIKKARKHGRYLWGTWLKAADLKNAGPLGTAADYDPVEAARRTWC
jgi:hypothetical protein